MRQVARLLGLVCLLSSSSAFAAADCKKLSECLSPFSVGPGDVISGSAVELKHRNSSTVLDLGILQPKSAFSFDCDRWMWSNFDKAKVTAKYPYTADRSCGKFENMVHSVVNCANGYTGRSTFDREAHCAGGPGDYADEMLRLATQDGFLSQLKLISASVEKDSMGGKHTVYRSPILMRLGIEDISCAPGTSVGCYFHYDEGALAERKPASIAPAQTSKPAKGGEFRILLPGLTIPSAGSADLD